MSPDQVGWRRRGGGRHQSKYFYRLIDYKPPESDFAESLLLAVTFQLQPALFNLCVCHSRLHCIATLYAAAVAGYIICYSLCGCHMGYIIGNPTSHTFYALMENEHLSFRFQSCGAAEHSRDGVGVGVGVG